MSIADAAANIWDEYVQESGLPTCAFSTRTSIKIGTGATTQRKESKILWLGTQVGEETFEVQRVNSRMAPSGDSTLVPAEQFFDEYHPEIEIFNTQILPAMRKIKEAVERGDEHRLKGEPYSAEFEYNIALEMDERCVKALFGMGLVYLDRNELDKARNVFKELVGLKAPFLPKHKHLFNDFGIQMRKKGLYDEALTYYRRGLEFDSSDENLHFNIARASYDKGDYGNCVRELAASLSLNSSSAESREFAQYLVDQIDRIVQDAKLENTGMATPLRKAVAAISDVLENNAARHDASETGGEKLFHYDRSTGQVDIVN